MSEISKALLAFQKAAPPIQLDQANDHFRSRFPSLANVVKTVRPVLVAHGLACIQPTTNIDGAPALETRLIHGASGEEISAVTPLILPKDDPQGYGSALTYARRYALLSILGLVGDEDDDANTATRTVADPHGLQASRADAVPTISLDAALADPKAVVIHWSRNKGKKLGDLSEKSLSWYANDWQPDPDRATDQDWTLKAAAQSLAGVAVTAGVSDTDEIPF